jgi:hypothetical protein
MEEAAKLKPNKKNNEMFRLTVRRIKNRDGFENFQGTYCPLAEKLANSANDVGSLLVRHFRMHGQTDHLIAQTKTNG